MIHDTRDRSCLVLVTTWDAIHNVNYLLDRHAVDLIDFDNITVANSFEELTVLIEPNPKQRPGICVMTKGLRTFDVLPVRYDRQIKPIKDVLLDLTELYNLYVTFWMSMTIDHGPSHLCTRGTAVMALAQQRQQHSKTDTTGKMTKNRTHPHGTHSTFIVEQCLADILMTDQRILSCPVETMHCNSKVYIPSP